MNTTLTIAPRFCGPPDSGNGGYTAGLIAGAADWPAATVTLRMPPPLGTELDAVGDAERLEVRRGGLLVAEAVPGEITAPPVEPVPYAQAGELAADYPGLTRHPFPTCFTCGPRRAEGDGLRIFPGRLPDGRTAAAWRVPADVTPAMVWASLDCPGGWVNRLEETPRLLGRLTARVHRHPRAGEECVVMGRLDHAEGRKARVTTTLYGGDGEVYAQAAAVWLTVE